MKKLLFVAAVYTAVWFLLDLSHQSPERVAAALGFTSVILWRLLT